MNYQTSPIKRARRTKRELDELLETILKILDGETGPITLRHLFYRLSGCYHGPADPAARTS